MTYEKSNIAVDAVICTIHDTKLKILLHTREKEPYKGQLELPGGILLENETAETTIQRKLQELLKQKYIYLQQFNTFTEPTRDPRGRIISIGYLALINSDSLENIQNFYDINTKKLAFDHTEIVHTAIKYLKDNISAIIIKQFMPETFPLNKLQEAYELIEETTYDNRNFRKRMISQEVVEETKDLETNVSHRPAKLYRFKK